MSTSEPTICHRCKKPTQNKSGGLVTQFLNVCTCNIQEPGEESIQFCSVCTRAIGSRRAGSITQFLFGPEQCQCDRPEPTGKPRPFKGASFDGFLEDEGEVELQLDGDRFPIDRYKALKEIGKGAAGVVYLCRDRLLEKRVAVKILQRLTPEQLISFQDEARATSRLNHPNIIQILDFGVTTGGFPFMVMEYVDGRTIETYLSSQGPFEILQCVEVVSKLCSALEVAHKQGIFHRDLKPSNILLIAEEGRTFDLRLIDFGIAKVKEETGSINVFEGIAAAGTPGFMPPDTVLGWEYGAPSEVYSLGCLMYAMLTGVPPFTAGTPLQTLSKQVNELVPPIQGMPPELSRILERCLSKKPFDRYTEVSRLREALADAMLTVGQQNMESFAMSGTIGRAADRNVDNVKRVESILHAWLSSLDRFKGAAMILAATLLLVLGLSVFLQSQHQGRQRAEIKVSSVGAETAKQSSTTSNAQDSAVLADDLFPSPEPLFQAHTAYDVVFRRKPTVIEERAAMHRLDPRAPTAFLRFCRDLTLSREFKNDFARRDNKGKIDFLYDRFLGRRAEPFAYQFWTPQLPLSTVMMSAFFQAFEVKSKLYIDGKFCTKDEIDRYVKAKVLQASGEKNQYLTILTILSESPSPPPETFSDLAGPSASTDVKLAHIDKGLRRWSQDPMLRFQRAELLLKQGDPSAAYRDVCMTRKFWPGDPDCSRLSNLIQSMLARTTEPSPSSTSSSR